MKKPTKTKAVKAKKIKARKMWAFAHLACYAQRLAALCYCRKTTPVFVLPADDASVESMVEQMARALFSDTYKNYLHFNPSLFEAAKEYERNFYKAQARAALAAIGIK